jgi:DNA-binding CsgD family transcriptional regulator
MSDHVDSRTRILAIIAVILGIGLFVVLDLIEDPESSFLDITINLLEVTPVILTSVGIVLLVRITNRQRDEHMEVLRDLEIARIQGKRWRNEARSHLNGLGQAIEAQFSRWSLTEAEREVALLLLKGLATKEIAAVRSTSERTVREQARSVYTKAGLSGRSALSAFFLEDLLAPIDTDRNEAD